MKNNLFPHKQMKIAVHLHLYYTQMWHIMKSYLKNLEEVPYDLYVTLVQENSALEKEIRTFAPNCKIFIIENRGYDVGPFIYFLHKINLQNYDLILKIHAKNIYTNEGIHINGWFLDRKSWFFLLINALIGSKKIVYENLKHFSNDPKLGMIASHYLITDDDRLSEGLKYDISKLMLQLGCKEEQKIVFVPGTMFWVRSHLLQKIKENFCFTDFDFTKANIKNGSLGHIVERIFGCLVHAQGYQLKGFDKCQKWKLKTIRLKLMRFLFQYKVTKKHRVLVKICKIPIYCRKLKK